MRGEVGALKVVRERAQQRGSVGPARPRQGTGRERYSLKAQARRSCRSNGGAVRRDCEGSERGKEIALGRRARAPGTIAIVMTRRATPLVEVPKTVELW